MRIEYIFATPSLGARLRGCDVVATPTARQASDHLPIGAEFAHRA